MIFGWSASVVVRVCHVLLFAEERLERVARWLRRRARG